MFITVFINYFRDVPVFTNYFRDVRVLLRDSSTFLLPVCYRLQAGRVYNLKLYCYELTYCTRHFSVIALFYYRYVIGYKYTTLYERMHNQCFTYRLAKTGELISTAVRGSKLFFLFHDPFSIAIKQRCTHHMFLPQS